MNNFFETILNGGLSVSLIGRIIILVVLGIYFIFTLIMLSQIRSLNRIVYIRSSFASPIVTGLAILYVLATASIFFLALAIL